MALWVTVTRHKVSRGRSTWYSPTRSVDFRDGESNSMPRATELSLRLALDRMARLGATASDIARQLSLPSSTVRGLIRRSLQAGPDRTAAALQPRYHGCGPRPLAAPPLLESTLELRGPQP